MFCSNCGTAMDEAASFCSKCGTRAGQSSPSSPSMARAVAPPAPQVIVIRSTKSAGLAAVLSFFWCGLGQIYNGQIAKGLIFGALYFFSMLLIFALIGIITTPLLWVWGMVDAYRTAEGINQSMAT